MVNTFTAILKCFETPGQWHYVAVPPELSIPLEYMAVSFGYIAVTAKVGNTSWPTSLMPKGDGSHFIALPKKVRQKEKLSLGAQVEVSFTVR